VSPTARLAALVALVALSALVLPAPLVALAGIALAGAAVADARALRGQLGVERRMPATLARGVLSPVAVEARAARARRATVRQAAPAALRVEPPVAEAPLAAHVRPLRRGRHELPPAAARFEGPLGLVARHAAGDEVEEVAVYPDLPAARRLALAVRSGRFREEGRLTRGPLGLGTDFHGVRDYLPDDDVRQVNWRATARLGRPMSNEFRVEQDRELICLVDVGRLMAAPLGDRTRLDAALDAVAAVGLVADAVGDRCGAIAFDRELRRELRPRRGGGEAVVRALFDLEPSPVDSDYELAFRAAGGAKRALVIVLTDILDERAARPLVSAVPVLARRHAVVVASAADADLEQAVEAAGDEPWTAVAAADLLAARARVARELAAAGAEVVEAPPRSLAAACVRAYLTAKARARL
jgi:uncharacterized protein (DUF58 family)